MTLAAILAEAEAIHTLEAATAKRSTEAAGQPLSFTQMREHVEAIVKDERAAAERWEALRQAVEGKAAARAKAKKPVADIVKAQLDSWAAADLKEDERWTPKEWAAFARQHKLNPESVMAAVRRYTKKENV